MLVFDGISCCLIKEVFGFAGVLGFYGVGWCWWCVFGIDSMCWCLMVCVGLMVGVCWFDAWCVLGFDGVC